MKYYTNIYKDLISRLDPGSIGEFIHRQGYTLAGSEAGVMEAYKDPNGYVILLPINKKMPDYHRRIIEILDMFVVDDVTIDDVISLIALPDFDIFRYRIESPSTAWGNLNLWYSHEATHALFDVLKFTAAGVSSQRQDYRQIPDEAKSYAKGCRLGQTELGSYVFKVYCPIRPPDSRGFINYGRETTKSTIENFVFASSEESENPSIPLPPAMNRQVASAINRLKPETDRATSSISVRFSPTFVPDSPSLPQSIRQPIPIPSEPPVNVELNAFIYSRAQSIRDRLKKAEKYGRESFVGYITDLHKDRPKISSAEQSRQISMEIKYGSSFRKITMRLVADDYRKAVTWHDNNQQVRVDAVFDKDGRPWTVNRLFELSLVEPQTNQLSLF